MSAIDKMKEFCERAKAGQVQSQGIPSAAEETAEEIDKQRSRDEWHKENRTRDPRPIPTGALPQDSDGEESDDKGDGEPKAEEAEEEPEPKKPKGLTNRLKSLAKGEVPEMAPAGTRVLVAEAPLLNSAIRAGDEAVISKPGHRVVTIKLDDGREFAISRHKLELKFSSTMAWSAFLNAVAAAMHFASGNYLWAAIQGTASAASLVTMIREAWKGKEDPAKVAEQLQGEFAFVQDGNYKRLVAKKEGTCEPGERADLTGCTPASADGGKKPGKSDEDHPDEDEEQGDVVDPIDVAKAQFKAYKRQWAEVNNELLAYIDYPNSPQAKSKVKQLKSLVKKMYSLHASHGTWEEIGMPGGPRDVVVIGGGPGGMASSIMGGTDGLNTLYIEGQAKTGGQSKYSSRIENYPGFPIGISGKELSKRMREQAERVGAEGQYGVKVVGLTNDPKTHFKTIKLSNGEEIKARSVIVAGGLEFRKLNFKGSDSDKVIYGDAEELGKAVKGKPAVIIGGSNGAAQAALGIARHASKVYVLSRSKIEEGMSDYQVGALRANRKVQVIEGDSAAEFDADHGKLKTKGGEELDAEGIGIFIGSVPETSWLPKEVAIKDGKVGVNNDLETGVPGVFAIGDIRHGSIGRIGAAVGDGQMAEHGVFNYFERVKAELASQGKSWGLVKKAKADVNKDKAKMDEAEWYKTIDEAFALDEQHPFFGQSYDGLPPLKPKEPEMGKSRSVQKNWDMWLEAAVTIGGFAVGGALYGLGADALRKLRQWYNQGKSPKEAGNALRDSVKTLTGLSVQKGFDSWLQAVAKLIGMVEDDSLHGGSGDIYNLGNDAIRKLRQLFLAGKEPEDAARHIKSIKKDRYTVVGDAKVPVAGRKPGWWKVQLANTQGEVIRTGSFEADSGREAVDQAKDEWHNAPGGYWSASRLSTGGAPYKGQKACLCGKGRELKSRLKEESPSPAAAPIDMPVRAKAKGPNDFDRYAWAVADANGNIVSETFTDRALAVAAANDYIRRTGRACKVVGAELKSLAKSANSQLVSLSTTMQEAPRTPPTRIG